MSTGADSTIVPVTMEKVDDMAKMVLSFVSTALIW
jgi:hypothetical protein